MDFFESQAAARRKSFFLVGLYLLAVVLIILGVYLLLVALLGGREVYSVDFASGNFSGTRHKTWWDPQLFFLVTGGSLLLVFGGTFYKLLELNKGGKVVAEMLGGRLINASTEDPSERKVLNVVEEMAIASGTPIPPVYILDDEEAINAFAAGYQPSDAVIGVTKGCVEHLSRDELQGVIAHEFSHILNGDMNLNIRLIGLAHGLLVMAMTGYWLLRISSRRSRILYARKKNSDPRGFLLVTGLVFLVLGWLGVFLARIMKAAISRQREFLADASAVQFTRNPQGIAGALKKIGGFAGSKLQHSRSEEASHLFFSNGLSATWFRMFATHPPLVTRIRRIDPNFTKEDFITEATTFTEPETAAPGAVSMLSAQSINTSPQELMASVGHPSPEHLKLAKHLLAALPSALAERVHETYGARAIVYALLLDEDQTQANAQLQALAKNTEEHEYKETLRLLPEIASLRPIQRLPLLDLCLPTLRQLSPQQYVTFRENVEQLARADNRYTLFEYALLSVLTGRLDRAFGLKREVTTRRPNPLAANQAAQVVLSALGHLNDGQKAIDAFTAGKKAAGLSIDFLPQEQCSLSAIDPALETLSTTKPLEKKRILNACAEIVLYDGEVAVFEAELLRAIGESLDCPIPPFLSAAAL